MTWIKNPDNNQWIEQNETLDKSYYNNIRQDLDDITFYSKCLKGSSFVQTSNLDDVFTSLKYVDTESWSIYDPMALPQTSNLIDDNTIYDQWYKYNLEMGFSIKNKFTPSKVISDSLSNFLEVDLVSTEELESLTSPKPGLFIDGIRVLNTHLVLIKDQKTYITLDNSIDPDIYFEGNYYIVNEDANTTEYFYFNEDNGIYQYIDNTLIKTDLLSDYKDVIRYTVYAKQGVINFDKMFILSRLKSGYYPTTSENLPIEFLNSENWIVRNSTQYQNILDINYNDSLKHELQTIGSYSIQERNIFVGEFGSILLNQGGYLHNLYNKYKNTLNQIIELESRYIAVGDNGVVLEIDKINLSIDIINIDTTENIKSISFFGENIGILVGSQNTIFYTKNGGNTWIKLNIDSFEGYNFNKCLLIDLTKGYIVGDNGKLIQLDFFDNIWNTSEIVITKKENQFEDFTILDNINDVKYVSFDNVNNWDINNTSTIKECLFFIGDNGLIGLKDLNNFSDQDFLFLIPNQSISNISSISNNLLDLYLTSNYLFKLDLNNFLSINTDSNVLNGDIAVELEYEYNNSFILNENLQLVGDNITLNNLDILTDTLSDFVNQTFKDNLKSKFLFLDYDVASKLNFFGDDLEYRLPNSLSINIDGVLLSESDFNSEECWYTATGSVSYDQISNIFTLSGTNSSFYNECIQGSELYDKKIYSSGDYTFNIYSDTNVEIDISNTGEYSTYSVGTQTSFIGTFSYNLSLPENDTLTFKITNITNESNISNISVVMNNGLSQSINESSILNFMSIDDEVSWLDYDKDVLKSIAFNSTNEVLYSSTFSGTTNSIYINIECDDTTVTNDKSVSEGLLSFTAPSSTSSKLYFNDNLLIIRDDSLNYNIGDILYFDSSEIKGSLMINRIEVIAGFQYLYIDAFINEEISNNLISNNVLLKITNLNLFNSITSLTNNINKHKLGLGYEISLNTEDTNIQIDPLFNEKTAYYNLQNKLTYDSYEDEMLYSELFMSFGYTARYNLLDYLSSINPVFNSNKQFLAMPIYNNLLEGNAGIVISDNKLSFNSDYKFEFDTFWINTFIDIEIDATLQEKFFILDKTYDQETDRYILHLHKTIDNTPGSSINIISRRRLDEISSDLNELNNIQKNYNNTYNTYRKELNFKFNTDSYARIFLSDGDIKKYSSAVIYTDNDNEFSLNLIDLGINTELTIQTINFNPTLDGLKVKVVTNEDHNLKIGDYVLIKTNSLKYSGFASVIQIVAPNQFVTDIDFITPDNSGGIVDTYNFDPSLNFIPIDVYNAGIDGKTKIGINIKPEQVLEDGNTVSIINFDPTAYKFNLIDGLYVDLLADLYPWILEADILNAVIGQDNNGIVWYTGTWECGRWFDGTWYNGTWIDGEWYNGNWYSYKVDTNQISATVNRNVISDQFSKWFNGNFRNGTWFNGSWYNGRHINGEWINGDWFNGQWDNGTWNNGKFQGGVWITGQWINGLFNCDFGESIWIDGIWSGGDFECGIWKDGQFSSNSNPSRFGTRPNNTRKAIWESGIWYNGEFHSLLNIDENGNTIPSLNHKLSYFKTGIWYNGEWYGGTAYNIRFENGTWKNGVVKDISILEIFNTSSNSAIIKLEGVYEFNNLDEIWIIDNESNTPYEILGTNYNPGKYIVKDTEYEFENGNEINTYLEIFNTLPITGTSNIPSKLVSRFKSTQWDNGIFFNGIFDGDIMSNCMWINGTFLQGEWL